MTKTMVKVLDLPQGNDSAERIRWVASFLKAQQNNLPDYLQLPFGILLALFNIWPIVLHQRPFDRLTEPLCRRQLRTWKNSRFEFRRNLVRFFETMILFAWYSESPQPEDRIDGQGRPGASLK